MDLCFMAPVLLYFIVNGSDPLRQLKISPLCIDIAACYIINLTACGYWQWLKFRLLVYPMVARIIAFWIPFEVGQ